MKFTTFKAAALVAAVASAFATQANAAGFMLTEQSAGALGRAYAGVGVDGTDISGTFYNPATMALHQGTKFQAGFVHVGLNLDYAGDDGSTENGRLKSQTIPHGYITHQINDSTWVGLAMTVPFGMGTEFDDDWEGAGRGISAQVLTFDFNPNVAWKMTDKFSVGAGVSIQYASAELKMRNYIAETVHGQSLAALIAGGPADADTVLRDSSVDSKLEVDSIAWGFNLGAMWCPAENLRFGVSYRSKINHDADGDLTINNVRARGSLAGQEATLQAILRGVGNYGTMNGEATLSTPAWVMVNAAWDVNDLLSLYATFRWTDWSSFDELKITSNGVEKSTIRNDWKDTYLGSLGADLRLTDWWTLRGGIAYESSPISDPRTRTAIIPDADRWWFAIGSSFKVTKDLQADVSFAHLHGVHERSVYASDKAGSERLGKFRKLDAYLFGVQMVYNF